VFEAWESFSIIAFKANCFGLGNLERVFENSGKMCEKYYKHYLENEKDIRKGYKYDLKLSGERYNWYVSSDFQEVCKEFEYRNLIKNRYEYKAQCEEIFKITKDIENQIDAYFKIGYEPPVPCCRTICGVFIIDVQKFINLRVERWVSYNSNWVENYLKDMFKDFAKSTVRNVVKKLIGPIDDQEVKVKIAADSQMREKLFKEMKLVESSSREMEVIDAWAVTS
jgi:hypothetical protein